MARLVKFEVFGQEFPLYTDAPEEEVKEILELVKSQFEEHVQKSSTGVLPANKVAVLSSLNMAGKYVKLKKDFEAYKKSLNELLDRVNKNIDSAL